LKVELCDGIIAEAAGMESSGTKELPLTQEGTLCLGSCWLCMATSMVTCIIFNRRDSAWSHAEASSKRHGVSRQSS